MRRKLTLPIAAVLIFVAGVIVTTRQQTIHAVRGPARIRVPGR